MNVQNPNLGIAFGYFGMKKLIYSCRTLYLKGASCISYQVSEHASSNRERLQLEQGLVLERLRQLYSIERNQFERNLIIA